MVRKATRRIAVGAVLTLVGSLAVFVPSAHAVGPISQAAPFTGSVTTASSAGFTDQLATTGGTGTVTFAQTGTSTPPGVIVSTTGHVTTSGTLAAGNYVATGTNADLPATDTGTFTYTLTVTAVTINQSPPTTGTSTTTGSAGFTDQLATTGGNGTVTYGQSTGNPNLVVSGSGHVSTGGTLAAGPHTATGSTSDAFGDTGTFTYTLTVTAGTINQTAPTTGSVTNPGSAAFTAQLQTSGGNGPVVFAKTGGSAGLNVSSAGAITTTGPLDGGTYTATGTTADFFGDAGTFTYTLTVTAVVPGAPTNLAASPGDGNVTLQWTAPSDGGSALTGYIITIFTSGIGLPINIAPNVVSYTIGGLRNGTSYTFTVTAKNALGTGPASEMSGTVIPHSLGYWLVASDGGIFSFGQRAFYGSTGATVLNKPIVGMAATPDAGGYWLVASDGGIFAFGDAGFFGSTGGQKLNKPIVGMASTPSGNGYWLVASDGGIFTFGDAHFHGSTGGKVLNKPIRGMAATLKGDGYWLVASDGGIFTFGDAQFFGSTGGTTLNKSIVAMAPTASGKGYWLVAGDGGIFTFGDAGFYGSAGGAPLNKPIVGMERSQKGRGYSLVASDGGIFNYGDAVFYGSTGATVLNKPIVGMG